mgnify:CR=1 FL=1
MGYRTIAQAVTASFIEKKSEFIATLVPVQTADAAIACIEEVRKANRKARHNVYAYILRENHMTRYSDDGEPQGTAGVPVLNVLQKQNLTDVCCVVTRHSAGRWRFGTGVFPQCCTGSGSSTDSDKNFLSSSDLKNGILSLWKGILSTATAAHFAAECGFRRYGNLVVACTSWLNSVVPSIYD